MLIKNRVQKYTLFSYLPNDKQNILRTLFLLGFRLADVVWHLGWEHQRELYIASKFAVLVPRRLINEFFLTVFFDGVGVDVVVMEHVDEFSAGRFRMTVKKRLTDDVLTMRKDVFRHVVHIQEFSFSITDGDGKWRFFQVFHCLIGLRGFGFLGW